MPSFRRQSGAAAVLILGLALTACGSGEAENSAENSEERTSDPVAWVGAFCGGIGDVLDGVTALQTQYDDPQAKKDALVGFADSTAKAMEATADKLKELGPPSIPDGAQVHDTAVSFFTTSASSIEEQRQQLDDLDASAPDFDSKLSQVEGPDLQSAAQQAQALTSNANLLPAFQSAPECQQLGAGS